MNDKEQIESLEDIIKEKDRDIKELKDNFKFTYELLRLSREKEFFRYIFEKAEKENKNKKNDIKNHISDFLSKFANYINKLSLGPKV